MPQRKADQWKEWAMVPTPVPQATTIHSHTGESETNSSGVLMPRKPVINIRTEWKGEWASTHSPPSRERPNHSHTGELETSNSQAWSPKQPVAHIKLKWRVKWAIVHLAATRGTTIHPYTEKLEPNSRVLSIEPVAHIKVQRKEWVMATSTASRTIQSHTGELETRSSHVLLPRELVTPNRPYQHRQRSRCLGPLWPLPTSKSPNSHLITQPLAPPGLSW